MRQPTPDRYTRSIVLLGDFNPKIYQPAWFAAENLIGKQEAEGAKIGVIHPDVSIFSVDWARIEILRERFLVETTQQLIDKPLRDLVLGTFSILRHTPIRVLGINTSMHFRVASDEIYHNAGHRLAPKDIWEGVLDSPGLTRIMMRESVRRDGKRGYIDVRIEPSAEVMPGLFITVNDHYECDASQEVIGCDKVLTILKDDWEVATARAEEIIYTLLKRVTSGDCSK